MQVINRDNISTLTVTVTEKQTLSSPTFLMRFVSLVGGLESSCIIYDTSSYTNRYNLFPITEISSGSTDPYISEISLASGIWQYMIYEQTSTTNLDYRLVTNQTPLEIGLVKVVGTQADRILTSNYTDRIQ